MTTYSFENVVAWQKAHELTLYVYQITKHFPKEERFALVDQFHRAVISIEANIAEGFKKLSSADKLRFYNIAQGSLEECRDYHILSRDLDYISELEFEQLHTKIEDTSKLLNGYCKGILNKVAIHDDI